MIHLLAFSLGIVTVALIYAVVGVFKLKQRVQHFETIVHESEISIDNEIGHLTVDFGDELKDVHNVIDNMKRDTQDQIDEIYRTIDSRIDNLYNRLTEEMRSK